MEEKKTLLLSANLNLALCYLKINDYPEARSAATAAIELDPANEKAFFRRGQALLNIGDAEVAVDDFKKVLELEPNNKAAQNQLTVCQNIIKQQLQKEKKIYANMFDKFAKMDTQVKPNWDLISCCIMYYALNFSRFLNKFLKLLYCFIVKLITF